ATGSKYRAMSAAPRHESSGCSHPAETSRGQPTMARVRNHVSPALTARGVISSASGAGKPSMGVWPAPLLLPMPNRPLLDWSWSDRPLPDPPDLRERPLRRLWGDRIGDTSSHGLTRGGLPAPGNAAAGRPGEQADGFLLAEAARPDAEGHEQRQDLLAPSVELGAVGAPDDDVDLPPQAARNRAEEGCMVGAEGGDGAVVLAGPGKLGDDRRLFQVDGLTPDDDAEGVVQRVQQTTEALGEDACLLVRPQLQVEGRHRQQPDTGVAEIDVAFPETLPGLLELAEAVAGLDLALQPPKASGKRRGALRRPYQTPGGPDVLEERTGQAVR